MSISREGVALRRYRGFTLIELMVVLVIIGILVSIAYPSYVEYVRKGNRAEGQAFLSDVAARQERYFSQNNAYITSGASLSKLGLSNAKSSTDKYNLSLSKVADDGGYTLTATNTFNDAKCTTLTLNARGVKGSTGNRANNSECW